MGLKDKLWPVLPPEPQRGAGITAFIEWDRALSVATDRRALTVLAASIVAATVLTVAFVVLVVTP